MVVSLLALASEVSITRVIFTKITFGMSGRMASKIIATESGCAIQNRVVNANSFVTARVGGCTFAMRMAHSCSVIIIKSTIIHNS